MDAKRPQRCAKHGLLPCAVCRSAGGCSSAAPCRLLHQQNPQVPAILSQDDSKAARQIQLKPTSQTHTNDFHHIPQRRNALPPRRKNRIGPPTAMALRSRPNLLPNHQLIRPHLLWQRKQRPIQPSVAAFAGTVELTPDVFGYSYSSGGVRLRAAIAGHLNATFHLYASLEVEHVRVAAGATAVQCILAFALESPGETVLVPTPVYGRFELDFGNVMGVGVVYADTTPETCFLPDMVVEEFEAAVRKERERGVRVRAVMIVNPSNPLGRCYPRETLVAIMRFCGRYKIHLDSDEVYGLSEFRSSDEMPGFTSVLSIDPEGIIDPYLVHVEYGLAKDFASSGLRLGALVSRNAALHEAFSSVVRFHSPAGPSVAIAAAMFEDRVWHDAFIASSRRSIAGAYEFVTTMLREMGVGFVEANAGLFVYVDLSSWLPPPE
ncbi:1-aminocyclopropane-1-carboxylate synthase [Colletotrichum salicis]|uniref:1-aminocyclopropane-1-carboxylate synthase n=1 Tax=Colletotrichum salicis TaxID=1209931 RepID=A0A135UW33_9PEZI|nr:1-aminocyclopropane-1-carboxylate synthase [Colletotrichum salicis]